MRPSAPAGGGVQPASPMDLPSAPAGEDDVAEPLAEPPVEDLPDVGGTSLREAMSDTSPELTLAGISLGSPVQGSAPAGLTGAPIDSEFQLPPAAVSLVRMPARPPWADEVDAASVVSDVSTMPPFYAHAASSDVQQNVTATEVSAPAGPPASDAPQTVKT